MDEAEASDICGVWIQVLSQLSPSAVFSQAGLTGASQTHILWFQFKAVSGLLPQQFQSDPVCGDPQSLQPNLWLPQIASVDEPMDGLHMAITHT